MSTAFSDEGLAALWLVNTLDEVQLFEFFERTIDRDQPKRAVLFTCHIEDLNRREGMYGFFDRLHHHAGRFGQAVLVLLQLGKADVRVHRVKS